MQAVAEQDLTGMMPLAVVGMSGEYFGLELERVREFTTVPQVTPIPCCPSHVVGNINLRGEIVTLMDIRSLLNIPVANSRGISKAVITAVDDRVAGISIDEVFDVLYLHPSQVMPVPTATRAKGEEYLRGTAPYGEKMMSILDLTKMLAGEELVVNEAV